jgi:hypothetical protein
MKFEVITEKKKFPKKVMRELVGTALQIVFEYNNFGQEHISDMFDTFHRPKFSYDDLEDMTYAAKRWMEKGLEWEEVEDKLMKGK